MSYDSLGLRSGIGVPETKPIPGSGFADHQNPTPSGPPNTSGSHSQLNKKRRASKGKSLPEIRRSSSTPHMRNLALANSEELSPTSDKRRNKLGYHRTSVACTHCRRRKIRCLLNNNDPQGRCSNCIRLKKDCNFYPVEQTNPPDPRPQALAKVEGSSTATSTSNPSSPHPSVTSRSEQVEEYRPFTTISPNPTSAGFRVQPEVDVNSSSTANASRVPLRSHTFPYSHQMDNQWAPQGFPSSPVPEEPPSSAGYWRASPSTAPSTYGSDSNMSGGQTPATMSTASNMSYGAPHEGQGWVQPVQPVRSVSYGHIEGVPSQFQNPHLVARQDYRGRASPYGYPPSIDTSAGHVHGATHADTSAPLSAPLLAHTAHNYGYSPNWSPSPYTMHSAGHEFPSHVRQMGGPWYAEPSHLGQVEEEMGQPLQYSSHPPTFYSGP